MSDEEDYPLRYPMDPRHYARGGWGGHEHVEQFLDPYYTDQYYSRPRNRTSMPVRTNHELMPLGNPYSGGYMPYSPYPPPHHARTPEREQSRDREKEPKKDPDIALLKDYIMGQERAKKEAALKDEEDKLKSLEALIKQHAAEMKKRDDQQAAARAQEELAKKQAELKALENKKLADEKAKEVKAAAELAKLEAEKEAAKKAAEEKEKWDKEMAELKKKHDEAEAAKKKLDEEVKKLRPGDDMTKAPVRFKDAIGRKFSFPWHLCKTWEGMDQLIKQAFAHIDKLNKQVSDNQYELLGPGNIIILPSVWETVVKPDMEITMHMHPEKPKPPPQPAPGRIPMDPAIRAGIMEQFMKQQKAAGKKGSKQKAMPMEMAFGALGRPPMAPPPPGHAPMMFNGMMPPPPPPPLGAIASSDLLAETAAKSSKKSSSKSKSKSKASSSSGGFLSNILGGGSSGKKSSSKKKK